MSDELQSLALLVSAVGALSAVIVHLYNRVNKLTPANDKLGHFYWGTFYALVTDIFTDGILIAIVPLLLALSKELRDYTGLGNVEKLDVFFTILSGIVLYLIKLYS